MKYSKSMANLYHYVNFKPKEISGFSRLEIQGENVIISVKLCFPKMESGCLKLYIIYEKAGSLYADLITEGKMRQRVFTMKKIFTKDNLESMNINPEKIKGIYINFSDSAEYFSFWEKEEINVSKININERKETDEEKLVVQEEEPISSNREMIETSESVYKEESEHQSEENTEVEHQSEEKENSQVELQSEERKDSDIEVQSEERKDSDIEVQSEERKDSDIEVQSEEKEDSDIEVQSGEKEDSELDNEELKEQEIEPACEEKDELVHGFEKNELKENNFSGFEKINLMELRKLPKSEWAIANNSFLLHGYYNYHYISVKKEKGKWIIGIPGIFHPKEQQVACYFGFDNFIPEKNEDVINDKFGYWCKSVDINE